MKKWICLFVLPVLLGLGCQRTPGEVSDKVLTDWGLRERPEGYVSRSDRIYEKLPDVGKAELDRLNREARQGEVEFEQEGLHGRYYKEVRRYEDYYPLDVKSINESARGDTGYYGYIEYSYRVMQSPRQESRAEAAAEPADIFTGEEGREVYRYRFRSGGTWDGDAGKRTDR
ncbi:MAG: hypothetical protein ACLFTT_14755 [Candidatus Hydrogenedentota bacterium]